MPEYRHVEKPLLNQLPSLDWAVIDQAHRWNSSNRVKRRLCKEIQSGELTGGAV